MGRAGSGLTGATCGAAGGGSSAWRMPPVAPPVRTVGPGGNDPFGRHRRLRLRRGPGRRRAFCPRHRGFGRGWPGRDSAFGWSLRLWHRSGRCCRSPLGAAGAGGVGGAGVTRSAGIEGCGCCGWAGLAGVTRPLLGAAGSGGADLSGVTRSAGLVGCPGCAGFAGATLPVPGVPHAGGGSGEPTAEQAAQAGPVQPRPAPGVPRSSGRAGCLGRAGCVGATVSGVPCSGLAGATR